MNREDFDALEARKNEYEEQSTQQAIEKLINLNVELHKGTEEILKEEGTEKKKNLDLQIIEIKNELIEKYREGLLTLNLQNLASEKKNRSSINNIITKIKGNLGDLDRFGDGAMEVLGASREEYALVKRMKEKTKNNLTRFNETLGAINDEINKMVQALASFELKDVQIHNIATQIRFQTSQFGDVICSLKRNLGFDRIEAKNVDDFKDSRVRLFQMINCMSLISEDRKKVSDAIESRLRATLPLPLSDADETEDED